MEFTEITKWVSENWSNIAFVITSIISIASVIAKMTKTETDDVVVGKILQVVDKLALNNKPTEIKKK